MAGDRSRWKVKKGSRPKLDDIDPASTAGAPGDKSKTDAALVDLRAELASLQERLWGEGSRSLLVVLQAMDAAGRTVRSGTSSPA